MIKKFLFFTLFLSCSIRASAFAFSSTDAYFLLQNPPKAAYQNQELHLSGLQGPGLIEIYSIIGNKIKEINVQELDNFTTYLELDKGKMYVLRVTKSEKVYTLKLISP